jgi:hypothetical protein
LVRVLFFLNLSQINCLILSFKHDLYPPHQVDADLSDSTGEDQKQTAGDDVEGPRIPLIESITSNPIRSNIAAPVRPPAADQPVSAALLSGGQKQKCIRLASKCKATTSSDQVITELPSYHGSRNRLNLVSVNLTFRHLFEAFQHISQAIGTDAMAEADTQPAKKARAPSMRRILALRYVMLLTCILLLVQFICSNNPPICRKPSGGEPPKQVTVASAIQSASPPPPTGATVSAAPAVADA